MTRMKHYHLGCGESLQSNQAELQRLLERTCFAMSKSKFNMQPKTKRAKHH